MFRSLLLIMCLIPLKSIGQVLNGRNIVIITIDGIRWQEIFSGADTALLFAGKYISKDSVSLIRKFWAPDPQTRRAAIFPFFWSTIVHNGQIYGNRYLNNKVNVRNPYWFSYPGYSEIFTGFADTLINSNDYRSNPHENVLAFLNRQPVYKNKVAAFTNWNAFKRILNEEKSGFMVNDGLELISAEMRKDSVLKVLETLQFRLPAFWGEDRLDGLTYHIAKQFMQINHPKVILIGFGECDEWAHSGKYDYYLEAAAYTDNMIKDCWEFLQNDPFYKGNATLLITTDHGRGINEKWTSHNNKTPSSDETWFAVMGPGIRATGEVSLNQQHYQAQIAQTIASLAGLVFKTDHPVEKKIEFSR